LEPERKDNILDKSISNDILNNTEIHYNDNNDIIELEIKENIFSDMKVKNDLDNMNMNNLSNTKSKLDISNISICSNNNSEIEESENNNENNNSVIYTKNENEK